MRSLSAVFVLLPLLACGGKALVPGPTDPMGESAQPSERPAIASTDPNDVWLAFDASGAGNHIFVMRADGSALRQLATGTSNASAPAFSANGKALAFAGPDHVFVMDLETGQSHPVTQGAGGTPAWSPNGKLLAFTRDVDIYVVNADGTGERRLPQGPPPGQPWYSNYGHPVFTADGRSIIYDRRGAIEMIDVDGSNRRDLFTAGGASDIAIVALSPDGTELAFGTACGSYGSALHVVPISSVGQACDVKTPIAGADLYAARPAWGANGLLAYAGLSSRDVWTVPATGGTPTAVTTAALQTATGGSSIRELAWSPPGTVIP